MDKYLIPFLTYLKELGILENCLLCTSYDLKYRFHTEEKKKLWEDNIIALDNLFPELKLHCEIIATGFFMQAVLDDEFSISDFKKRFNVAIDYIEPGSGFYYYDKASCAKDMPDFFPTKQQVIAFLTKVYVKNKEIDIDTFVSSKVRSDKVYLHYNGKRYCIENRRKTNCLIDIEDLKEKYEIGIKDSNETIGKYVKLFKETIDDSQ